MVGVLLLLLRHRCGMPYPNLLKIQHQLTFLNADSKNTFLLMLTTEADFLVLLLLLLLLLLVSFFLFTLMYSFYYLANF